MRRFVLLIALASCHRVCGTAASDAGTSSNTADASISPEMVIESLLPKDLSDTAPFGNDNRRAVCGQSIKGTCDILQAKSAGKDAKGRDLVVVTVRTSEPLDAGEPDDGVEQREHWVIGSKDGVIVFRAPIASELARTEVKVDDSLKVGPNEVELGPADVAPSSWKSYATYRFRLSPLQLLTVSDSFFNSNPQMVGSNDSNLDLRDGSGEGQFRCETRHASYFPVPTLGRGAGFDPSHGLGKCAGDVDGTAKHGTLVVGAADRQNGWFRVAYVSSLYVEVHDDHFTPGDRLEMRFGRSASGMLCDADRSITKKITIDGTGAVSEKGIIEVKRIRDEPNVRTFEITFTNPKSVDMLSGFALDMVDDDGAMVRRLSTAPIGPELGSTASGDFAVCMDGPDGPAPVPLSKTSLPPSTPPTAPGGLAAVVRAWNDATNAHDAAKLSALYANEVELYGTKMTRKRATAIKNAAFAKHDHDTLFEIQAANGRATFRKQSKAKTGNSLWVDGYIKVDASMKIIAEGDTTTDENLAHKRESDCVTAIDALLASTPEGKKAQTIALRSADRAGPRWTLKFFSPRPGSAKEDYDLVLADEFEIDAASATITRGGKPMPAPAAMSRVAALCQ